MACERGSVRAGAGHPIRRATCSRHGARVTAVLGLERGSGLWNQPSPPRGWRHDRGGGRNRRRFAFAGASLGAQLAAAALCSLGELLLTSNDPPDGARMILLGAALALRAGDRAEARAAAGRSLAGCGQLGSADLAGYIWADAARDMPQGRGNVLESGHQHRCSHADGLVRVPCAFGGSVTDGVRRGHLMRRCPWAGGTGRSGRLWRVARDSGGE